MSGSDITPTQCNKIDKQLVLHKKPYRTLLTATFQPAKPKYQSGNSCVVDAGVPYFTYSIQAVTKIDVINSNVQRNEHNLVKEG